MSNGSRWERAREEKIHFATEKRGCWHIVIFLYYDNFFENVLKYNSTLEMIMWTLIETLKAYFLSSTKYWEWKYKVGENWPFSQLSEDAFSVVINILELDF